MDAAKNEELMSVFSISEKRELTSTVSSGGPTDMGVEGKKPESYFEMKQENLLERATQANSVKLAKTKPRIRGRKTANLEGNWATLLHRVRPMVSASVRRASNSPLSFNRLGDQFPISPWMFFLKSGEKGVLLR